MKPSKYHRQNHRKQRGAALVVGLIMLLLLTLIGVAGMKDTLLQQRMVANAKDREVALQAAESALRQAEIFLSAPTAPAMTNSGGLYDLTTAPTSLFIKRTLSNKTEAAFWAGGDWTWTDSNSRKYSLALGGVDPANPPRYVIEKLDVALSSRDNYFKGSGNCTKVCSEDLNDDFMPSPPPVSDYRITVKAVGSNPNAVVLVQSTFRRDKE